MPTDDYIKRSDAIAIMSELPSLDEELDIPYAEEVIMKIPAADVEPVRHGRWEYDSDGVPNCSECGEPALQRLHMYMKIRSFSAPFVRSAFCPNCGAKMDKEEDENV